MKTGCMAKDVQKKYGIMNKKEQTSSHKVQPRNVKGSKCKNENI